ncbi:MAG: YtxH domain-containing protein [Sphingobacteriia bacterium]|jgi:gas vesicle protein
MENSNDTVKIVGSMLLGSLVGAAIGVLFAPHKGSKTRRMLMNGAEDISDEIKSAIKDELHELRVKADELENMASQKISNLSNSFKQNADGHFVQK